MDQVMTWNEFAKPAGILVIGIVLVILSYMANCMISYVIAGEWTNNDQKGIHTVSKSEKNSIGSARMEKDGTIVLQLRAEGPNGLIGDALLRYPPTHTEYNNILRHLGGLKEGEIKHVSPWPSKGKSINSNSIIFSSEETKKLNLFGGDAPLWTPEVDQVQELESLLLKYLKAHPPIDDKPVGNLSDYGRQYFGVTKKDRKLIYLNAFCNPSGFDQWKKGMILVKDGGSCYFQVYFDPARKEFIHLHYNGQA